MLALPETPNVMLPLVVAMSMFDVPLAIGNDAVPPATSPHSVVPSPRLLST